ncbi:MULTISPECIES: hypothetical protein [unclassified Microcoleus]|uniref:hypothetical protein n=1 Tax=unclassified Microcoleus TaxID=2642155 RepID=UPI002FD4E6D0
MNATEPGSWKPPQQKLISQVQGVMPANFRVIVATERGLSADWLDQLIKSVGPHPFLRINHQETYRLPSQQTWQPLADLVRPGGQSWAAEVLCFKTNPLSCTLLARWALDYKDPWLILTDFKPQEANVLWYGLRSCTEGVYRDLKSDGWQWHHTRLLLPQRAERMWLVLAVSTLWMVILGGTQEGRSLTSNFQQLPPGHIALNQPRSLKKQRHLSCFILGFVTLMANLLNNIPIHLERWRSFPQTQ